eukprot:TRINITY_DN7315_c0_g1_i3.p1 TRINITY_DN7315_c0_g1~~TRINITY_DN7315_c0_g1_i3.p1  ORF type:complete len:1142 (+),score=411.60 TRINITY_DN7315_c0_g1_i3:251-3676(+)
MLTIGGRRRKKQLCSSRSLRVFFFPYLGLQAVKKSLIDPSLSLSLSLSPSPCKKDDDIPFIHLEKKSDSSEADHHQCGSRSRMEAARDWRERLSAKELKDGEEWYLVSCNWCDHLLSGSSEPGPINNSGLLDEKGNLLPGLTMTEDFRIVNKETWNDLLQTFSIASSQEPISRTVIGNQLSIYPSDLVRLSEKLLATSKKKLTLGESWYLLYSRWHSALKDYLEDSTEDNRPGAIDNSPLLLPTGELKRHIIEKLDFEFIDRSTWDDLVSRFGLTPEQEPIERKVVLDSKTEPDLVIDVHPLNVFVLNDKKEKMKLEVSKFDCGDRLIEKVRRSLGMEWSKDIKLRVDFPSDEDREETPNSSSSSSSVYIVPGRDSVLNNVELESGCLISVEKSNENDESMSKASIPAKPIKIRNKNSSMDILSSQSDDKKEESSSSSAYSSFPSRYHMGSYSEGCEEENSRPGICGLSNLGNTCFMNSIIQGLSNTPPITEYFANDNYIEDINKTNPLGMKGEIAETFGEMVKRMWSGRYKYIHPRAFKSAVGRFAPQFSGYQQQDSQELLTFLLDGLHEDLNRVKKKPYIEIKDSGDRPDEEVALEAWEVYKKRNDSVILDVFHGLLKSTLICPVCNKVSVTFDPFCYLSLPLPDHRERQLKVRVIWQDKTRVSTLYKLTVPKAGNVFDLLKVLSKASGIPEGLFRLADMLSNKIHRELKPELSLSNIPDGEDNFAFELPALAEGCTISTVSFKEERVRGSNNFFHPPLMINVKKGISAEELYEEILSHIEPLLKKQPPPLHHPEGEEGTSSTEENANKPPSSSNNNNATNNASSEESPEDSSLEDVKMNLGEDEEEEEEGNNGNAIFKLCILNAKGSFVEKYLDLSEENLFATKNLHIGMEWSNENKNIYFNEEFGSRLETDPSVDRIHQKTPIKLSDCLELYTTTEKLGEDDAWYCPRCSKHQQATKKFDLWSLPSILVISLKRFSYTRNWRDKLDTLVDFPVNGLDMSSYIINRNHDPAIYDLIAVSNHYGVMGGGHYTAMAKNKNDGEWYNFDDASVNPKKEKDVVTNAAYVLFYRRRETRSKASSSTCTSSGENDDNASSSETAPHHLPNGLNNGSGIKGGGGGPTSMNLSSSSSEEEEKMDVN